MPLNTPGLTSDLESLFASPGTAGDPPATTNLTVQTAWADAIRAYTTAIVPAVPAPAQDAARLALLGALSGLSTPNQAVTVLSAGLVTYAASLAAGMTPPGTPPPLPLSTTLAPVASAIYTSHAAAASAWATVIDAWFRTGLSGVNPFPPWS